MKKLFTLVVASFVAIGVSARQPQVIVNSTEKYDVKIDGQFINGSSAVIPSLAQGTHTVEIYSVSGGILGLGKKRTLVSSHQFNLRNNDVRIDVDQNGQARITEIGTRDDRRIRDDRTYPNDGTYPSDGTVKNHGTLQGKGKKHGHYKNKNKGQKVNGNGKQKNKVKEKEYDDRD